MDELDEIKDYWSRKYPNVLVTLWSSNDGEHFYGKMMYRGSMADIKADSIGNLISQGEIFLRNNK